MAGKTRPPPLIFPSSQIEESLVFLTRISETTVCLDFIRDKSGELSRKKATYHHSQTIPSRPDPQTRPKVVRETRLY